MRKRCSRPPGGGAGPRGAGRGDHHPGRGAGVKVGELCILRNPWEDWTPGRGRGLREAGGPVDAARRFAGISPATEVIPTGKSTPCPWAKISGAS
ncbi:MAG: hypothetical protein ACLSHC_01485 [Bilophila wadsworthia]